jgi:hypothetical protein
MTTQVRFSVAVLRFSTDCLVVFLCQCSVIYNEFYLSLYFVRFFLAVVVSNVSGCFAFRLYLPLCLPFVVFSFAPCHCTNMFVCLVCLASICSFFLEPRPAKIGLLVVLACKDDILP